MKKVIAVLILFSSCVAKQEDKSKQAKQDIINADKAMNELASSKGFYYALLQYADSNVIKPKEGELPVIGKKQLEQYWTGKEDNKAITWAPVLSEASSSGDLGFTFGNWKFTSKDTVMYGNYTTIWKKQTDGSWKFIYDGGNNTPKN